MMFGRGAVAPVYLVLGVLFSQLASAESELPPLERGLYLAPFVSYTLVDKDRLLDDGIGGELALGYRLSPTLAFELSGHTTTLDRDAGGDADMEGWEISALSFPLAGLPNLYVSGGAGSLITGPQGDAGRDYRGISYAVGLGWLQPLSYGAYDFGIRADYRHRHNNGKDSRDPEEFNDGVIRLGLQLPLGLNRSAPASACSDGIDNDGDGLSDHPADPGCVSPADNEETDPPQCSDGRDNDGNGEIDYPADPGCESASDDEELLVCPGFIDEDGNCITEDTVVLKGVNFELDSSTLTPEARQILNSVAEVLLRLGDVPVEVGGHTDALGDADYNQALSARRANAVKVYLIEQGIDPYRITAVGYGEDRPIADNETTAGRARNRRVELKMDN